MKTSPHAVQRVAIYNNKGGGGKTTFAVHLALLAEEWLINTFLVGLDRQGNALHWISDSDAVAKEDAFFERSPHLSAVYSPQSMPEIENAELVVADCPPEVEIALTVNPTLWVVPLHGRMAFQGLQNVLRDLIESRAEVLVVQNNVGRGGAAVARGMEKALPFLKGVTIYPGGIPESDTVGRAEDCHAAAWALPYAVKSKGAAALRELCEFILRRCGFSPPPQDAKEKRRKGKGRL